MENRHQTWLKQPAPIQKRQRNSQSLASTLMLQPYNLTLYNFHLSLTTFWYRQPLSPLGSWWNHRSWSLTLQQHKKFHSGLCKGIGYIHADTAVYDSKHCITLNHSIQNLHPSRLSRTAWLLHLSYSFDFNCLQKYHCTNLFLRKFNWNSKSTAWTALRQLNGRRN